MGGSLRLPPLTTSRQLWADGRSEAELTKKEREWFYEVSICTLLDISPKELDDLTNDEIEKLLAVYELKTYKEQYKQTRENVASMSLKTAQRIALDLPLEDKEAEERRWQEKAFEKLKPEKPSFLPDQTTEEVKSGLPSWLTPRCAVGLFQMNAKGYFKTVSPHRVTPYWKEIQAMAKQEGVI